MFTNRDLDDLKCRGIPPADAKRQLGLFSNPPPPIELFRPCIVDDGIIRLDEVDQDALEREGAEALASGRVGKFVPASGAASRMFQGLRAAPENPAIRDIRAQLGRFAFAPALVGEADPISAILRLYAPLPKALLAFHRYGDHSRTALEEHLQEAHTLGVAWLHFTVPPEHRTDFTAAAERCAVSVTTSYSEQMPFTDTLAGRDDGQPFRGADNRLVFRPGGHGALLENLNNLRGDLILIKNIDNITHSRLWPEQVRWKKILLGVLLRARAPDRPTRVCGVVKNSGEPGGGPFWVRRRDGCETLQIVESAQVDLTVPTQKALFDSATHFNPVDLACSVRDASGRPFDLRAFRDDQAVFLTRKFKDGEPLRALELPGLWNGAMAYWHTVFVEVPVETFNPVKTLADLLRPAHQPA